MFWGRGREREITTLTSSCSLDSVTPCLVTRFTRDARRYGVMDFGVSEITDRQKVSLESIEAPGCEWVGV